MSQIVGEKLRKAREARKISLEQAAKVTFVRANYLAALEAGDLSSFPSLMQARGFLRAYASYLDLEGDALLAELDRPQTSAEEPPTLEIKQGAEAASAENGNLHPNQPNDSTAPAPALMEEGDSAAGHAPKESFTDRDTILAQEAASNLPPIAPAYQKIYQEIAKTLYQQRSGLELTYEDIERQTHLRVHYLKAMDAGDFDALPSSVQAKGMLNNYADFLGLNPEPLLLVYAEALQAKLAEKQAIELQQRSPQRKNIINLPLQLRWLVSGEILLTGFISAFMLIFLIWGILFIIDVQTRATPTPTAQSIVDVLLAPPPVTETATTSPPTPTAPELPNPVEGVSTEVDITQAELTAEVTPVPGLPSLVQVYVTIRQRAWMRVIVDGNVEFEGRVLSGSAYQYSGEKSVEIITGDGAALQIFFNEQDLGTLGNSGEVVDRIFTPDGVQLPTPTLTPIPTETPIPSPTPQISPTPSPTPVL